METTRQYTCKNLLQELSDYLEGAMESPARSEIEAHLAKCPNCWVVCDTTKKTIQVFKGMEPYPLPEGVKGRLVKALEKKCSRAGQA